MNELPRLSSGGMIPVFGGRLDLGYIERTLEEIVQENPERIEITMERRPDGCYYTLFYVKKDE